jgi:RimK family alpha-L-glutamate ligase
MTGLLVINHFLNSCKFNEIFDWLEKAAELQGVHLIRKTNADLLCCLYHQIDKESFMQKFDFVLFWDKDIRLAEYLESFGLRVFNSSRAIEICDDKSLTHLKLMGSGIKMPKTIIAPKHFDYIDYGNYAFIDEIVDQLGFPLVVKECFGSFGQQVHLANGKSNLVDIVNRIGNKPVLFQEFIDTSKGRDIRIQVVGGQPVASMYRYTEKDDFRANISIGGMMKPLAPNDSQVKMAVAACRTLGLDFAGVDILFGNDDEPMFCEVNSNAHFKNIHDCTSVNVADFIISHIKTELENSH